MKDTDDYYTQMLLWFILAQVAKGEWLVVAAYILACLCGLIWAVDKVLQAREDSR